MTRHDPSEYPTRDIYLATVLKLSGVSIIRIENQFGRGIFVFKASPRIEELVSSYFNDELTMNPKAVMDTLKSLKSQAFTATNNVR